jgi:sterol 14alpha-demethylase
MPALRPPALPGLPLLGHALAFRRDPVAVVRHGHRALGPVFALRLGPWRAAVVVGPERHRFFFTAGDEVLSTPEVYRFLVPMFGETLQAAPTPTYREHRRIVEPSFHGRRLPGHVALMVEETRRALHALGDAGEVALDALLDPLSMRIAAGALLGPEARRLMDGGFLALYRDVAEGMEFVLPPGLPLPRFRRRDRARRELHARIGSLLGERRACPSAHADFLQTFLEATGADGRPLEAGTVADLVLLLVFAAFETTAAQAAWALVLLLQHPAWLEAVVDEAEAVLGPAAAAPGPDALRALVRLEWAIKESERLRPVTSMLMRHARRGYELDGYHVPAGWLTVVCPPVAHRLPDVFVDPDRYDPGRFAPERAEDRRHPFALITFGGGAHGCPGVHFARHEIKVILSELLLRYDVELADGDPVVDYRTGLARPRPPCRLRYRRRALRGRSGTLAAVPARHETSG